jgi:REP element-mobilizing transposase RayT
MARPLRIEFPGALYHVTARGNARAAIYHSDADRLLFLDVLGTVIEERGWLCHAYCLMPNHYHLLLETPEANLSRGMRQLNGLYSQRFNRRHDRVGHVFQGRFKGILVERESHLLELARYVVLNPVRAEIVHTAEAYRWSSLRATLGLTAPPPWLTIHGLLETFGSPARFFDFVCEGIGAESPWADLRGGLLGSEAFADEMASRMAEKAQQKEIPRRERFAHRLDLTQILSPHVAANRKLRNERIREACRGMGYSYSEVGRHLGLHCGTVSRIVAVE